MIRHPGDTLPGLPEAQRLQVQSVRAALGDRPPAAASGAPAASDPRDLTSVLAHFGHREGRPLTAVEVKSLRSDTATWLLVEETLADVGSTLTAAAIPFVIIKGAHTARLYPQPHLRSTSDLDVLIEPAHLARARELLQDGGWEPLNSGALSERHLLEEGHCWQALRPGFAPLELHFRFWGSVATGFEESVMRRARPLGRGTGALPHPAHALLIAAGHRWRQPCPRRLCDLVDFCLLMRHEADWDDHLLEEASRAGQELTLALTVSEALMVEPSNERLRGLDQTLAHRLRRWEKRVMRGMAQRGCDSVTWPRVRLASLLARRPSRAGWHSLVRQLWPHAGVIEQESTGRAAWTRRVRHTLAKTRSRLHGKKPARGPR